MSHFVGVSCEDVSALLISLAVVSCDDVSALLLPFLGARSCDAASALLLPFVVVIIGGSVLDSLLPSVLADGVSDISSLCSDSDESLLVEDDAFFEPRRRCCSFLCAFAS